MSLMNKPASDRQSKRRSVSRMRLAHPGRFLLRIGMLALLIAIVILTLGYLKEAGQTGASAGGQASPMGSLSPLTAPLSPTPTPAPTPTPTPTPPPAPEGHVWSDLLVVLDPGHGGRDPGTCTPDESIQEKDITLDVALRCAQLLAQENIPVLLTRTEDKALADTVNADLAARSRMANEADATLYVSIHVNSLDLGIRGAAGVFGLESYYRGKNSPYEAFDGEWLATHIGEQAAASSGNQLLAVIKRSLAVLRETRMPAVLLEIGYLTNTGDAERLQSDTYRQDIATGVARGITDAVALLAPQEYKGVRQVLKKLPEPTPVPTPTPTQGGEPAQEGSENPPEVTND